MKQSSKWIAALAAVLVAGVAAGTASMAQEAQVGSDKATYAPHEPIVATWRGLRKGTNAWIMVGRPGGTGPQSTADQSQSLSNFNGDVSAGKHTFRGYASGTYEIRLIAPPYGSETVLARMTITVKGDTAAPGGADQTGMRLTTAKPSYAPLDPIEVKWEGIRLVNGWVGIGRPGGSTFDFNRREPYTSLPSNHLATPANGSHTFAGLLPGEYELRIIHGELTNNPQVLLRHKFAVKE